MQFLTELMTQPLVLATGLVAGLVLAYLIYRLFLRGKIESHRHDEQEARLKAKIAEKAARTLDPSEQAAEENLTDSGIFSVLEMMDALVSGGNLDEAEKWAINAIHHHPNRADVPVKLAQIYYQAGRKSAFMAVVRNLSRKQLDVPDTAWRDLARMGAEIAPDDPFFEAMHERLQQHPAGKLH